MLAVVRPSPLRLWGFILTVVGGALIAFGSIGDWAAVSLGGSVANAVPTKGVDVWQGRLTLLLGALIVVGVLALRFVRPERRASMAVAIIALAVVALALALWSVAALSAVVRDSGVDGLVRLIGEELGLSSGEARRQILRVLDSTGIDVRARLGLWLAVAGGGLAVAGGVVDLMWVGRKRAAGDAIDPDTLAVARHEAPPVDS